VRTIALLFACCLLVCFVVRVFGGRDNRDHLAPDFMVETYIVLNELYGSYPKPCGKIRREIGRRKLLSHQTKA
jgi:hypothetical protein